MLCSDGFSLVSVAQNLVDTIWDERPPIPDDKIVIHPMNYAGNWRKWFYYY